MLEEKPKRKPRVPLSSEELFYYKKLKLLKEQRKIEDFKNGESINAFLYVIKSVWLLGILLASNSLNL